MKEIRRENLRKLLASPRFNGDRAKLIQDAGITKGRLAQLLDDDQPFGDAAARNLCEKLDLPENFFNKKEYKLEGETGTYEKPLTYEAKQIGKLYDLIPEDDIIRRSQAYSGATTEIVRVLEGHKPKPIAQLEQGQKKQPV